MQAGLEKIGSLPPPGNREGWKDGRLATEKAGCTQVCLWKMNKTMQPLEIEFFFCKNIFGSNAKSWPGMQIFTQKNPPRDCDQPKMVKADITMKQNENVKMESKLKEDKFPAERTF